MEPAKNGTERSHGECTLFEIEGRLSPGENVYALEGTPRRLKIYRYVVLQMSTSIYIPKSFRSAK